MSSDRPVIRARGLGKCYQLYAQPQDRLKQFLWRGKRRFYREFWALRGVDFEIMPGEVVGIIGRNGSGKSTLLQLVCGTLTPTDGEVSVQGRVAALLELGAGFNPEFTGRENVFMSAAVMGLSQAEIAARYEDIVEFSGIRDFIDQPVKTYSSGMYVRLAFSVAISVDPDILVIDEALSVGDGEFARKSFDRIMALKDAGKTILFCSHSMYQVEALCSRAMWLNRGRLQMLDIATRVTVAYQAELDAKVGGRNDVGAIAGSASSVRMAGRILKVEGAVDGVVGTILPVLSKLSVVEVKVEFIVDTALPIPSVAVGITSMAGVSVASAISTNDGVMLSVDGAGRGQITLTFPAIPLLKGEYSVSVFLACERALHPYEIAERCLTLLVTQEGVAQGIVDLPHEWRTNV
ncbi:MAG: ABC transporter ATP-binding protein [Sulfuricellaceae bacterium]|nr:ABC transporter ATP-binding protein [Sulfuricellaceae bacterium]